MKLAKRITGTSQKSFGMYEQAARLQGDTSDLIHLEVAARTRIRQWRSSRRQPMP
ncbi:hypothetical protein [Alcaligenes phenolicus]|uniref:hypothetical protein n=1 Tax=Alcaligenes phenolicus TaxID=232846 RepID=UPI002AA6481F|nr:hypothetical protein [Alcaligenes phenolicus]